MRHLDPIAASCDGWIGNLPFLDDISQQLNLPRRYLSLALGGLFTSFILFGLGQSLLCTAVGVLYPAYMSMKALKALEAQPLKVDTMQQWLTYWICYSIFSIVEEFAHYILFWVPFYYLLKISFLVWLMHPYSQGAQVIYNRYLQAAFTKYSQFIDANLSYLGTGANAAGAVAGRVANVVIQEASRPAPPAAAAPLDPQNMFGPIRPQQPPQSMFGSSRAE